MLFNEQQRQFHLLSWLNLERRNIGQKQPILSKVTLSNHQSLLYLLKSLGHPFTQLEYIEQVSFFNAVCCYMENWHGRTAKKCLKQRIITNFGDLDYIGISCYCLTQSHQKQEYIDRILKLPQLTQKILMNEIQSLDENFENMMEIKEILFQVQELERQNISLNQKIRQYISSNYEIQKSNAQISKRNQQLRQQVNTYSKQKQSLFQKEQITSLSQYKQLYAGIQKQNTQLQLAFINLDKEQRQKQHIRQQLKNKIKNDCEYIYNLSEELNKIRKQINLSCEFGKDLTGITLASFSSSRMKKNVRKFSYSSIQENDKQNILEETLGVRVNHKQNIIKKQIDEETSNQHIIKSNQNLMQRLEILYKQYNILNTKNIQLQNKYKKLQKHKQKHQKTLSFAKQLQNSFLIQYLQPTDSQNLLQQNITEDVLIK